MTETATKAGSKNVEDILARCRPQPAPKGSGLAEDCLVWEGAKDTNGYGQLYDNGKMHQAHRWLHEALNGLLAKGYELHHKCRVKGCVTLSHIEVLTHEEHTFRHRQEGHFPGNRRAGKCTDEDAETIRNLKASGTRTKDIMALFGLSRHSTNAIIRGDAHRKSGGPRERHPEKAQPENTEQNNEVWERYESGQTTVRIAAELDLPKTTVVGIITRMRRRLRRAVAQPELVGAIA